MNITTQPHKNTAIPTGATHWQPGYTAPFVKIIHTPCDSYTARILQNESQNVYLPDDITKIDRSRCYRLVEGQWMIEQRQVFSPDTNRWEDEPYRPLGRYEHKRAWRDDRVIALQPDHIPADAPRVNTIYGAGTIVGTDHGRTLVDLDNNTFSFRPCALNANEIH